MPGAKPVIGILGAGRLGLVLAQLASRAGYPVLVAGSADPKRIALPPDALAQGVVATTRQAVAGQADVVILALPLPKFRDVPAEALVGIVDDLGFDPVRVGRLADGVTLEPGTEPFGADVDAIELRAMIDRFATSQ